MDKPQFNHNGGTVAFGPDGKLYVSVGDGGGANDVGLGHVEDWYADNAGGNGQDITDNLLGSILRIDVDTGAPYAVPPDNPFVGKDGLDEIWAYGFRNPYRMSFDGDRLFAGDAGQVVVGGHVYRGGELPQLRGRYVFGDWSRSFARPDGTLLVATSRKSGLWPIQELEVQNRPDGRLGHFILGFGRDARGEVYVLTSNSVGPSGSTGRVYRLVKPGQ